MKQTRLNGNVSHYKTSLVFLTVPNLLSLFSDKWESISLRQVKWSISIFLAARNPITDNNEKLTHRDTTLKVIILVSQYPSFLFLCSLRDLDWVQSANPVESWLDVKMYNFMQQTADQK